MEKLSRKTFLKLSSAAGSAFAFPQPSRSEENRAILSRIKMATIGAADVNTVEEWYTTWLKYTVVERGKVHKALARSWGAPKTAGRKFITMQSDAKDDVYIRAIEVDWVPGYKAITTWGWNAIEIIVDDIDTLHETMRQSPFRHIGGPSNLGGNNASIRAAQYIGPAEDVIYLTCETGNRDTSPLPIPRGAVDRPFIMILSGIDIDAMESFYADNFNMTYDSYRFISKGGLISKMQGHSPEQEYNLGLIRCRERGNNIELDEYLPDTKPRPAAPGQLPPGIAMTSFNIDNLDAVEIDFITEPIFEYSGKRSATFVGPTGELTELIEEDRT